MGLNHCKEVVGRLGEGSMRDTERERWPRGGKADIQPGNCGGPATGVMAERGPEGRGDLSQDVM